MGDSCSNPTDDLFVGRYFNRTDRASSYARDHLWMGGWSLDTFAEPLQMNYISHHNKKKWILERKELRLQRLIASGADVKLLVEAAKEIRQARIRVLRVKRSLVIPKDDGWKAYERIDAKIHEVESTSIETILAEYGYSED